MNIGDWIRMLTIRKGELAASCECGDNHCGEPVPSCCHSCDTCGCGRE